MILRVALTISVFLCLVTNAAYSITPNGRVVPVATPFKYELFLSDVQCWITGPCEGLISEKPERELAARIDEVLNKSKKSADFAIFGLREQQWFLDRLTKLKARGVHIRLTLDQLKGQVGAWTTLANFIYPDAFKLIEILGKNLVKPDVNSDGGVRTASLMHHKFFVLDERYVWVGSTNISDTETGAEYNANSSILIDSPEIAELYKKEFEQMFVARRYSIYKSPRRSVQTLKYNDGSLVTVYFAPQEHPIDRAVIPFIHDARTSIDVPIFYLTSLAVADELIAAHQRGVQVRVINDATAARNQYGQNDLLRAAGIDVRVENWGGKMHMKTAIRDGKDVIIGSANWTKSANDDNDENLIVIEDNRRLARELGSYFEDLWDRLPPSLENPHYHDPRPEGLDSINSCVDGINNDHRGALDAEAAECQPSIRSSSRI